MSYLLQKGVDGEAVLSRGSGCYRYRLVRRWGGGGVVCWVMCNPSTADALQNDPTIRRCIGFSTAWGYGGLVVVNLFAFRATEPAKLLTVDDPVGPENESFVRDAAQLSDVVVAAWGALRHELWMKSQTIRDAIQEMCPALKCLGTTKRFAPRHPLYVAAETALKGWP